MHTITSIAYHGYNQCLIVFTEADTGEQESLVAPTDRLLEVLVELHTKYHFVAFDLPGVTDESLRADMKPLVELLPTVVVNMDYDRHPTERFVALSINGDTGFTDEGRGASIGTAIANLARAHGFVSKIDVEGPTLSAWFEEFKYGLERASNERLEAELDAVFVPEKGSW